MTSRILTACVGLALVSMNAARAAEEDKYPERNASAPAVGPQTIRARSAWRRGNRFRRPSTGPAPATAFR